MIGRVTVLLAALLIGPATAIGQTSAPFDIGGGARDSSAPSSTPTGSDLRGGVDAPASDSQATGVQATDAPPMSAPGGGAAPPATPDATGVPFFSAAPVDGSGVPAADPSGAAGSPPASEGAAGGFRAAPAADQGAPSFEPYRPPPPPSDAGASAGGAAPFDLRGGASPASPAPSASSPFSAGTAPLAPGTTGSAEPPAAGSPPSAPVPGSSPFSVGGGPDEPATTPFRLDTTEQRPATPGRGFTAGASSAAPAPSQAQTSPSPPQGGSTATFTVAPPDPNTADGATPFQIQSGQAPPPSGGTRPASPFSPNLVPDRDEAPIEPAQAVARGVDRPILPRPDLRLTGETDFAILTVYLSAVEAARPAIFSIGIVNSVLVMPEASRLRVSVNGRAVTEMQINSTGRAGRSETRLPGGLLRAGANTVRIEVTQRHRVDCSLRATYELWTMLVPSLTGFIFQGGPVPVNGLADLPSIGVDDSGATRINVVPVGTSGPDRLSRIAAAVSAASVFGRFEHPVAKIVDPSGRLDWQPGHLALVVGTAAAVREVTEIAAGEAAARPVVALMPDPRTRMPTLVVSGPTPDDVDRALARLSVQAERSAVEGPDRRYPWRAPDVPIFYGGEEISLAELGVQTSEFSGRRFQTHFDMALPDDFYAAAYGEAILLLDAAFTPEVKPGSTIDVYVNKALAVTVNITSQDGGLYDKRQVKIPLRNFRPGPNRVHIEANLDTDADERCLPGATMPGRDRFVMFSSSVFRVAPFARFGELPNLAAFAAGSFPYGGAGTPVPVYLVGEGPSSIAAASTLLARLSISAGVPLPNRFLSSAVEIEDKSAVIVGAAPDLDPLILDQTGLSNAVLAAWSTPGALGGTPAAAASSPDEYESVLARLRALKLGIEPEIPERRAAPTPSEAPPPDPGTVTSEVYERWRSGVGGTGVSDVFDRFTLWLKESFGLTLDMLHLAQAENRIVRLAPRTTAVIAQARGPGAAVTTWTLVTAPSGPLLASGVEGITAPQTWYTIGGSVAAYQETTGIVQTFFPASLYHMQTVPFTFQNARLIAANWFSLNVLEYALALMLTSGSLGIVSWVLIRQIGRENNA